MSLDDLAFQVRAAEAGHFWLLCGGVALLSVLAFFAVWYLFSRLRLIEDTPQSMIRSAAQGQVEFSGVGRVMPGPPIVAPLSRRPCVWWYYCVEEYVRSGKSSHYRTLRSDDSRELFLIADGTGQCVVDPEDATVYTTEKDVWYGDTVEPFGPPETGKRGFFSFSFTTPDYRYTERLMPVGAPIYALGYFHTQGPITAGDIDAEVRQQLAVWKKDQAWLLRNYDANHDGQVDAQEWEHARDDARRLVLERERENMQRPPVSVLSRAPDGRPFILSAIPQSKLVTRLRLYVLGSLLVFVCAGALGTWLLDVRMTQPAWVNSAPP